MLVNHKQHFAKFCQHIKHQIFNLLATTDYHLWCANILIKMLFSHHFSPKNEQNIAKKSKSSKFQEKPYTPPHQQKKRRFHPINQDKIGTIFSNPLHRPFTDPSDPWQTQQTQQTRQASVRFNIRRAIPWDLWDLCEPSPIIHGKHQRDLPPAVQNREICEICVSLSPSKQSVIYRLR